MERDDVAASVSEEWCWCLRYAVKDLWRQRYQSYFRTNKGPEFPDLENSINHAAAAACSRNVTLKEVQWRVFTIHCVETFFRVITSGGAMWKAEAEDPSFFFHKEHLESGELWPHIGYEGINVSSCLPAMTQVIGTGGHCTDCNKRTK